MPTRAHFSSFSDMPRALRRYLFSQDVWRRGGEASRAYKLSEDQSQAWRSRDGHRLQRQELPGGVVEMKRCSLPTPVAESNWKLFVEDFIKRTSCGPSASCWRRSWPGDGRYEYRRGWVASGARPAQTAVSPIRAPLPELMSRLNLACSARPRASVCAILVMGRVKGLARESQIKSLMRQEDFGCRARVGCRGRGRDGRRAFRTAGSVEILSGRYADWLAEQAHHRFCGCQGGRGRGCRRRRRCGRQVGVPAASLAGVVARGALWTKPLTAPICRLTRRSRRGISRTPDAQCHLRACAAMRSSSDLMGLFQRDPGRWVWISTGDGRGGGKDDRCGLRGARPSRKTRRRKPGRPDRGQQQVEARKRQRRRTMPSGTKSA